MNKNILLQNNDLYNTYQLNDNINMGKKNSANNINKVQMNKNDNYEKKNIVANNNYIIDIKKIDYNENNKKKNFYMSPPIYNNNNNRNIIKMIEVNKFNEKNKKIK